MTEKLLNSARGLRKHSHLRRRNHARRLVDACTLAATRARARQNGESWSVSRQWQPQEVPQPPPALGVDIAEARSLPDTLEPCLPPTDANTESNLTVSAWPSGHCAGRSDALIARRSSNTVSQVRQRNS